jgi:hypothetical protein
VVVCALLASTTAAGWARQTPSITEPADVFKLTLASVPEVKRGKVAIVEGVAGPSGQKLSLADLSVLQPVEVSIFTPELDDDVRIELSKFILDEPARTGSTKGTASATFKFRTQGDLQIKVLSPDGPNVYRLFVWVGDEATPEMPAPFISMETYKKRMGAGPSGSEFDPPLAGGGNGGGTPLCLIIAGALGLIVVLLAVG